MTLVPAERETAALAFVCGYHDPQRQRIAGGKRMFDLRRREALTLLGGAAVSWPLAARAQSAKLPTIGFLGPSTPLAMSQWVAAFAQRLRELGWTEGRTVAVEYRWAEGRNERLAEIAAEFVRLKVDVFVTYATPPVIAAKQATGVIPIVSAVMGDPVGTGLIASLARPGGTCGIPVRGDASAHRVVYQPRYGRLAQLRTLCSGCRYDR
jgi:hypothetical protein